MSALTENNRKRSASPTMTSDEPKGIKLKLNCGKAVSKDVNSNVENTPPPFSLKLKFKTTRDESSGAVTVTVSSESESEPSSSSSSPKLYIDGDEAEEKRVRKEARRAKRAEAQRAVEQHVETTPVTPTPVTPMANGGARNAYAIEIARRLSESVKSKPKKAAVKKTSTNLMRNAQKSFKAFSNRFK